MILVQLGVNAAASIARQRAYAYAHDRRLGDVARDVVERRLRFAPIGLLQARAIHQRDNLADQLQAALNSRVIIEQAKGVIAERRRLDMDQ